MASTPLDNAHLLAAEQQARRNAEARDRLRRLHQLVENLAPVVRRDEAVRILVSAGCAALGAAAGFAWLLRDADTLVLAATEHGAPLGRLEDFRMIPRGVRVPVWDVLLSGRPLMFEDPAAMAADYPEAVAAGAPSFAAWAVLPVIESGAGIGAVAFAFAEPRGFSDDDRELLSAMVGQASLALERCRLVDSEWRAVARERQLYVLAARLSNALVPEQVASIASEEVVSALGAYAGAVAVRAGEAIQVLGTGGRRDDAVFARSLELPAEASSPLTDAVVSSEFVWCASEAALNVRYAPLERIWRSFGIRAWAAVPFAFEDSIVGALTLAFAEERAPDQSEQQFLYAVGQLVAQALERARLYEAHRVSEERLRVALTAARAGTFAVDLKTGWSVRDSSYRALLGSDAERGRSDFELVHPDDRAAARAQFERSVSKGRPYEPEVRLRRDDGSYFWVRAHGRVIRGADGMPRWLSGVVVDIDEAKRASLEAEEERRVNETLYRLGGSFASELDESRLIQLITDELRKLTGADFGAFLEPVSEGAAYAELAISLRESGRYERLDGDAARALLGTALDERRVVRHVRADDGAEIVVSASHLAVPVLARSGEAFGVLLFGHPEPDHFTPKHERLAAGVAAQSAVALENARLYQTVREHKEQLELAVARAALADRRKDEFLAMLGHELRNPLAPIATALALMELKGADTLVKERAVIRRQVDHLKRLVDDLLDVSRITRGKIELAREVVELGLVLTKAVETVSPLFEQRKQRLTLDVPRSGLLVNVDAMRLGQVFENLLSNAAKYSDVGAEIRLCARAQGSSAEVEVSDPGLGILPELVPRMFDLFVQGERAIDRSQGGLGIGLAIAKSLTVLHGGTISAASEGPGHGSTFSVSLPRVEASSTVQQSQVQAPFVRSERSLRVLVVDDNVDAAQTLEEFLKSLGHTTALAHDGVAALEVASAFAPTVALVDVGLPLMDGYEVARRIRRRFDAERLLLVAVTGYGQDEDRARALDAGFDQHLVKPIELDRLSELLTHAPHDVARSA